MTLRLFPTIFNQGGGFYEKDKKEEDNIDTSVDIFNGVDDNKTSAETITTKRVQVMDENAGETYVDAPPLEDITGASGSGANLDIAESKLGQKKYRAPRYKGPYFDLP